MNITEFLSAVILIALLASWMLTLAYKWNIIEWVQVNTHFDIINKMCQCNFCLSWWTCVGLSVSAAIAFGYGIIVVAPFFSTIICKCLIR